MYSFYITAAWQNFIRIYSAGGFRKLSGKYPAYVWTFPFGNFRIITVLSFPEISTTSCYSWAVYIADWRCYADNMDRRIIQRTSPQCLSGYVFVFYNSICHRRYYLLYGGFS